MPRGQKGFFLTAGVQPDPLPHLEIECGPDGKGVGRWVPRDKHRLLAEYLYASRQAWKRWPHRIFIDPFCGPGRIHVAGEQFTRDGGAVAAWRELAAAGVPFTKVLIGDKSAARVQACCERLRAFAAPVTPFCGLAVDTVKKMVKEIPDGALCFAYVDPYSLEFLSFDILQTLATLKNVDMAVHFSTMDLRRNIELEFDRARFDDTAPRWKERLPAAKNSKQSLPLLFFEYWRDLVSNLDFRYSKEMPLVFNEQQHPIYRLVFFARHDLPLKIWSDIARSQNLDLDFGE